MHLILYYVVMFTGPLVNDILDVLRRNQKSVWCHLILICNFCRNMTMKIMWSTVHLTFKLNNLSWYKDAIQVTKMPKIGYLSMHILLSKIILLVFFVLLYILEFCHQSACNICICVGQTHTFSDHKYMYCSKRTMYDIINFTFWIALISFFKTYDYDTWFCYIIMCYINNIFAKWKV